MAFVQKSLITMALGLDRMQRATCESEARGLCPEMLPVNGSTLLQHLMNVSFSFLNEDVYFDELGDPPGKYEILNFRRRETKISNVQSPNFDDERSDFTKVQVNSSSPASAINETLYQSKYEDSYSTLRVDRSNWPRPELGKSYRKLDSSRLLPRQTRAPKALGPTRPEETEYQYEYALVGSWSSNEKLNLFAPIRWPAFESASTGSPPQSVCSLPCAKGQAKVIHHLGFVVVPLVEIGSLGIDLEFIIKLIATFDLYQRRQSITLHNHARAALDPKTLFNRY